MEEIEMNYHQYNEHLLLECVKVLDSLIDVEIGGNYLTTGNLSREIKKHLDGDTD